MYGNRKRFGHAVHRHDAAARSGSSTSRYMSAAIGCRGDEAKADAPRRADLAAGSTASTPSRPAPAKPTAPQDAYRRPTPRSGGSAPASTLVPPTSIGASTVGAALRWNSGIAVHSTSPDRRTSHARGDGRRGGEQVMPCWWRRPSTVPSCPDVKNRRRCRRGSADGSGSAASVEQPEFSAAASASPWTRTDRQGVDLGPPPRPGAHCSLGVGDDHRGLGQPQRVRRGSRPCSLRSPPRAPRRCARPRARSTPTPGRWPVNSATVSPLLTPKRRKHVGCGDTTGHASAAKVTRRSVRCDIITRSPNSLGAARPAPRER